MFTVLFCVVSLVVPLIIGMMILRRAAGDPLIRFTGWMTLKPIFATPLWFCFIIFMASNIPTSTVRWLGWIPGVLLTMILVFIFRDVVLDEVDHPLVLRLLGLDIVRWGSTALMYGLLSSAEMFNTGDSSLGACFMPLAIFMPTIFAAVALYSINTASKHKLKHEDESAFG